MKRKYIFYSKRILILAFLFCVTTSLQAQIVPKGSTPPPATPIGVPGAYTNTTVNYIRTWEPNVPTTSPATVINATTVRSVKQTVQYFDGLGRPLQAVTKGVSPTGKDLVEPVTYDNFGREQFKYLPYVQQSGNTDDGKFKKDPFASQRAFYWNASLNPGVKGDSVFYTRIVYENSPLNRVSKTYAPGNSWAMYNPSSIERGGNRPVENRYQVNTVEDSVRIWNLSTGVIPTSSGAYAPGNLFKNMTRDEDGKYIIEYKDKEDKVILKKLQLSGSPGTAHVGWLCTYYVYDDLNNLRMVIPPQAVMEIRHNWTMTTAVAGGLCFIYRYDGRNRMIVKKLPGADSTEMVYDKRDRLIFTRDGNLKKVSKWLVTFYDNLNRPNKIAFYYAAHTRAVLQQRMDGITADNPIPDVPATSLGNLSFTYYDNYSFSGKYGPETADLTKPQAGSNPYVERPTTVSTLTRGLVTGTKTKVLGINQWLNTTIYYDDNRRVIQTIADNVAGGKDIITNLYDFSGKLLSTYLRHTNPHSTTIPNITVLTQQSYDTAGRPRVVRKRLNDDASREKITVANYYDELGRLKTKRLGVTATGQLEVLNYEYNIRGWLRAINKEYLSNSTVSHFGQTIYYDWGFSANQYNGNIAGIRWKGWNDKTNRAYGFTYDIANRLTGAAFTQQNAGSSSWTRDKFDFSVSKLAYDGNGNILSMAQKGMVGPVIQTVDSLKYGYQTKSNKLSFVTDKRNNPQSQLGDFKEITSNEIQDYWFDASGNMAKDKNKNIDTILYNHLNLPDSIVIRSKGTVRYHYDAVGNKLRKIVIDKTVTPARMDTMEYIGGMVYKNDTLQFISHEEGRIRPVFKTGQPVQYVYDYFVKDHLGNVRLVLTEQSDFSTYTATMETENAPKENALFSNIDQTRSNKPVGYPQDNTTSQNAFVAKLNAQEGGKKIGPSLVLRVMAGDTLQIGAKAFYKSQGPKDNKQTVPIEDMVSNLVQAFGGGAGADGVKAEQADQLTPFTSNFYSNDYQRLKERDPNQNRQDKPRSYLNFVLFDDQFNLVEENSGVRQIQGEPDELQTLGVDKMPIQKSGFLYVYTSNESQQDVFFDNVVLGITTGPVLEETHYYPFGGTLAGISVNALKGTAYPENRHKYNGKELQHKEFKDGSGLEWYDYGFREYDQQIGRFFRIDPLTEKFYSLTPYQYSSNNPVTNIDLDGLEGIPFQYVFNRLVVGTAGNTNGTEAKLWGAVAGVGGSIHGVANGLYNTVAHPVEAARGLGRMMSQSTAQNAVEYGINVASNYTGSGSDAFTEYATGAHVLTDIGIALSPLKGATGLRIAKGAGMEGAAIGETVAAKSGTIGFRYMTEGELSAIKETGLLRGGRPGETFFTKDLYKSSSKAQERLALPSVPTHRVEFEIMNTPSLLRNGTKVQEAFGMPGKGAEFMTTDPVKVKLINWQQLRP